jgi:2-methylcitrate dehydratase PrpD
MRLSERQLTEAIGIAINSHITMRQVRAGTLSQWKVCSAPNAARNGIVSASLAKHGFTGPSPIFEGEMGFEELRDASGGARVPMTDEQFEDKFNRLVQPFASDVQRASILSHVWASRSWLTSRRSSRA